MKILKYFKKQRNFSDGAEYHIHFGPGKYFKKDKKTICVDFVNSRADIKLNFNHFNELPINSNSISSAICITCS